MKKTVDFYEKVYEVVRQIPDGKVTSYGAIAKAIGAPKSARTVGYAMNNSLKNDAGLPAHRVVNRNGVLTGKHHFNEIDLMQKRLEAEGHVVENDQIKSFQEVFWDPFELY
ncbi:MAG: MGMT family protein [Psychroflexus halocasei]